MLLKLFPIWIAYFLAAASPGPSQVFVMESTFFGSRRRGRFGALGISIGTGIWVLLVAFGLNQLVNSFARGPFFLKCGSVLLLTYFLVRNVKAIWQRRAEGAIHFQIAKESAVKTLVKGVGVNLMNPNSVAFFLSLFAPLLVVADAAKELAVCILGVMIISILWYQSLVSIAAHPRIQRMLRQSEKGSRVVFAVIYLYFLIQITRTL